MRAADDCIHTFAGAILALPPSRAKVMIRIAFAVVAAVALAACAPMPPTQAGEPLPPTTMTCRADPAIWAVGKQATADIVERVRVDSHSRITRMLRPGQMVTMEFSAERVDIRVDGHNVILAVTCG